MFHTNGRKRGNLRRLCNCVKQNVVFLDKMFHIKGARWRLVPYVILEGRSPDRSQSIKRDRSDAAFFAYGGGGQNLIRGSVLFFAVNQFHHSFYNPAVVQFWFISQ